MTKPSFPDSRGFNHQQYADISDKWCLISSWTLMNLEDCTTLPGLLGIVNYDRSNLVYGLFDGPKPNHCFLMTSVVWQEAEEDENPNEEPRQNNRRSRPPRKVIQWQWGFDGDKVEKPWKHNNTSNFILYVYPSIFAVDFGHFCLVIVAMYGSSFGNQKRAGLENP